VTLRLATVGGPPLRVTLLDAAPPRPRWTFSPVTALGISGRIGAASLGTDGYEWTIGLAGGRRAGLGLAWYPLPPVFPGLFASGAMGFADFDESSGLRDRSWSPSASVGFELFSDPRSASSVFARVGFLHVFDDGVPRKDGVMFMFGSNGRLW
jgi:hypothetical protein